MMNNLQVPDPGLLYKLEQLLTSNTKEEPNIYSDLKIVCSDGELQYPALLLCATSNLFKNILDGQIEDHVVILPEVETQSVKSCLKLLLSSSRTPESIKELPVLKLLGVTNNCFDKVVEEVGQEDKNEEEDLFDVPEVEEKKKSKRKMFCKFCNINFQTRPYSAYQDHINSHKNQDGFFECVLDNCGKLFQAWCHYTDHFYCHDESPKPHLCSYCDYTSITRANVRKHEIAVHEDPDERNHSCNSCEKKFKTRSNLLEHMKIHGKPALNCDYCGKSFKSNIGLKQHERNHTGELLPCNICGEKFQSKHSVKRHEQFVHARFKSTEGQIKCPRKGCELDFKTMEDCRIHVKTAHQSNGSILVCHLCKKMFPTTILLKEHFKICKHDLPKKNRKSLLLKPCQG